VGEVCTIAFDTFKAMLELVLADESPISASISGAEYMDWQRHKIKVHLLYQIRINNLNCKSSKYKPQPVYSK